MQLSFKQYRILTYIARHPKLSGVLKKYKTDYIKLQDMLPNGAILLDDYSDDSIANIVLRDETKLAREDYIRNSITAKIVIGLIPIVIGSLITWLIGA